MYRMNALLGKYVINQATGERIAQVDDIIFSADVRSVVALVLTSGGWFSSPTVVRWGSVASIGDVVVAQSDEPFHSLKDDTVVNDLAKSNYRLTGTPVITASGERIGAIHNVFIDERGMVAGYEVKQGMLSGNKFLPTSSVQTVGKDAVIAASAELTSVKDAEQQWAVQAGVPLPTTEPLPVAETSVSEVETPVAGVAEPLPEQERSVRGDTFS